MNYTKAEILPMKVPSLDHVIKSRVERIIHGAKNATSTIPCEVKCNNCGVCANLKTKKIIAK